LDRARGRGGYAAVRKALEVILMNVRSLAFSLVASLGLLGLGPAVGIAQHEEHGKPAEGKSAEAAKPAKVEPISKKSFLERDGQKLYFCCNDCKGKYEADPAAYKAKLAASYTYQAKCPVTGEDIDPTAFSDLPTKQRVYYCCMACEKKLLAEPDEYAPKLAAQGLKVDAAKLKKALAESKSGEKPEKAEKGEKKGEKP
jgi:YHS domain-containing protein